MDLYIVLCNAKNFEYTVDTVTGEHTRGTFSQETIVEYNEAIVEYLKELKQRMPDMYILGNGMVCLSIL